MAPCLQHSVIIFVLILSFPPNYTGVFADINFEKYLLNCLNALMIYLLSQLSTLFCIVLLFSCFPVYFIIVCKEREREMYRGCKHAPELLSCSFFFLLFSCVLLSFTFYDFFFIFFMFCVTTDLGHGISSRPLFLNDLLI